MNEHTTDEPVEQPIETRTRVPSEDPADASESAESAEDSVDSGSDPIGYVTRMPPDSASG